MRGTCSLLILFTFSLVGLAAADGDARRERPQGDRAEGRPCPDGERLRELRERFDTDGDGRLDESERAAARAASTERLKERHPELFQRIDKDGDGSISEAEGRAARQLLHRLRERRGGGEGRGEGEGRGDGEGHPRRREQAGERPAHRKADAE